MIFPQTSEKLARSYRLLDMLRESRADSGAFEALLDAVVIEGRAVTFVLQAELSQPGLAMADWYEAEQAKMRRPENNALPWLHEARTLSTHQVPLGVGHGIEVKPRNPPMLSPGEKFGITANGEMFFEQYDKDGNLVRTVVPKSDLDVRYYRIITNPTPPKQLLLNGLDFSGQDAVTIVSAYLDYLSELVQRAESEALRQVLHNKFDGSKS
jgi:hypothetical protein